MATQDRETLQALYLRANGEILVQNDAGDAITISPAELRAFAHAFQRTADALEARTN